MDLDRLLAHAEPVVSGVTAKSVENYCRIGSRYGAGPVADDDEFQRFFAYFYRMTRRGLTQQFRHRYFELLDSYRGVPVIDIEAIVRELHSIPNSRNRNTLQYSFATKLAHTANTSYPIYDSLVAKSLGFRPVYYGDFEQRLARLSAFYAQVASMYSDWRSDSRMQSVISEFRRVYGVGSDQVSDVKVIDFLMWSAGRIPEICSQEAIQPDTSRSERHALE